MQKESVLLPTNNNNNNVGMYRSIVLCGSMLPSHVLRMQDVCIYFILNKFIFNVCMFLHIIGKWSTNFRRSRKNKVHKTLQILKLYYFFNMDIIEVLLIHS